MNDKITKKYLKAALKNCPFIFRKRLRADLYNSICYYFDANPKASENEFFLRFGSPEQYSAEYIASLEDGERFKLLYKNRFVKRALTICIALVVLLVAIGVGAMVYDVYNSDNYYYRTNIEEI